MGCLFVMMAAFAPRLGVLFIWLARPALVVVEQRPAAANGHAGVAR